MKKIFYLLLTLIATTSLGASNVITYTATSKLPETTSTYSSGLHTNAFNVSISSHTFDNGIGTITFAGEITTIGDYAFYGCSGLTSVTIPNTVTTIGDNVFEDCFGIISINVDATNTHYSSIDGVLFNHAQDTLMKYPTGNTRITYTIPNSVTMIGYSAFSSCSGLTSVTIPNSVTSIGYSAFSSCSGLTSVTIPNSVTSIGGSAFSSCSGLTSVTIPNSVTMIGYSAFSSCSGLTSVTIPNSVTTIGDDAFAYCTGLTSVTIPNSVTTIGNSAFSGCIGLTKTNYTGTIADWCKIKFGDGLSNPICQSKNLFIDGIEVKDLVISESVDTIVNYAFLDCYGLTSVTIPNSVTTIGHDAFSGCHGLTSISIPNSVTTIGGYAFSFCSSLNSVTIPNSVTTIGKDAFYYCDSLISVIIPNAITMISERTFYDCSGLTSVTIGKSVTTIGNFAFSGCSSLTSVTCLALEPPSLGANVFYDVPRDIPLYVPVTSIPAYKAAKQWNEFNIQPLLVDIDPITPDTTQLSWLPVDSASLYKLRIFSEQIALDTTLLIEADSLNGGISIPITLAPQRVRRMPMDDIGSVVVITLEPNSGATKETPFRVTVSTTSKNKIDILFDMDVLKGEKVFREESGSFTLNNITAIVTGLDKIAPSRWGCISGIYDLYGRHYSLNQWNQLPAGIYILRDGEKASKMMKQ